MHNQMRNKELTAADVGMREKDRLFNCIEDLSLSIKSSDSFLIIE